MLSQSPEMSRRRRIDIGVIGPTTRKEEGVCSRGLFEWIACGGDPVMNSATIIGNWLSTKCRLYILYDCTRYALLHLLLIFVFFLVFVF